MKARILMPVMLLIAALAMVSCDEPKNIPSPGDNSFNLDSIPVTIADTSGVVVTVTEANAIVAALENGQDAPEVYKISGSISSLTTSPSEIPMYTNITFYLSDGAEEVQCYKMNNINNRLFLKSADVPGVGSKVTVLGILTKYNNKSELKDGFIVRIDEFVKPQ